MISYIVSIYGFDFFFDPWVVFEKVFSYPVCLLLCCFGLEGPYFCMLWISTCTVVKKLSFYYSFLFKCIEVSFVGKCMDNFCQHLKGNGRSLFFKAWHSKYIHTTLPIIYSAIVHPDLFCLSNLSWVCLDTSVSY